ncbi:glycosyltransferase [Aciditerrimonas ferrireducens]|uniref:Glycosyltransferase n=1 Tax=Aciditerrimonas ferrireducens TaxID=667306 RepID=A0ABV6C5H7_9ACTN
MLALDVLAVLSAACWVVLALGRNLFWLPRPRLPRPGPEPPPGRWPALAVVVPARDEAALLPTTLPTLLHQDYPGRAVVVVVDDGSTDGTAEVARQLAAPPPPPDREPQDKERLACVVVRAGDRPAGWAGKVWALAEGAAQVPWATWLLFTDADIQHPPGSLRALVGLGESRGLDQVSVMARLEATGWSGRLLVPAFVYFFAMLYPFRTVTGRSVRRAAAAGGCLLVRRARLEAAGGLASVAGAVIDDVGLAKALARAGGRLWLGYDRGIRSVRPYPRLADLWAMVRRSAYAQLRWSPAALAGTVLAMALVFLVAPVAVVVGLLLPDTPAAVAGGLAWVIATLTFLPLVLEEGVAWPWALGLPLAAFLYLGMTLDSARQHRRGGPQWKGRALPGPAAPQRPPHAANDRPGR